MYGGIAKKPIIRLLRRAEFVLFLPAVRFLKLLIAPSTISAHLAGCFAKVFSLTPP